MSRASIERLEESRRQMRAALQDPGLPLESLLLQRLARQAKETLEPVLEPMARKHPLLLVLGAALLGGCLVAAKPWRWKFLSLVPTFLPSIASALIPGLVQQGVLDALLALLQRSSANPPADS